GASFRRDRHGPRRGPDRCLEAVVVELAGDVVELAGDDEPRPAKQEVVGRVVPRTRRVLLDAVLRLDQAPDVDGALLAEGDLRGARGARDQQGHRPEQRPAALPGHAGDPHESCRGTDAPGAPGTDRPGRQEQSADRGDPRISSRVCISTTRNRVTFCKLAWSFVFLFVMCQVYLTLSWASFLAR